MPNYCQNTVFISHENSAEIERLFLEAEKEKSAFFDAIRPTPSELLENGWYQWRLDNWGTKWNPNIFDCSKESDGSIRLDFDTAWAPPIELYQFMTENGFKIDANYSEDGMCFRGTYTSEDGDCCENYDPEELEDA
jgi:hypothetical protein